MSNYENGFHYRGGSWLERPIRARWSETLPERPWNMDIADESISMSQSAAEAFTRSWISMMTAHPITMETLDKIAYLIDEARMNHPDQVWNNEPVAMPRAVAEFLAQEAPHVEG
jgi:hypothetical protein